MNTGLLGLLFLGLTSFSIYRSKERTTDARLHAGSNGPDNRFCVRRCPIFPVI